MRKNRKAFTLIELLAVIVILAIIALITVPLILNVIETAKKGSFKDTAYGLIESAELYYSKEQLKGNNIGSKTFTFPEASELSYKGEKPKSGNLVINKRGQVALAISNDKYCIIKDFTATEVTLEEDYETCELDIDTSGANEPDLLQNMIPIKYDGENWKYVKESQSWFNYSKKQWGNAVVLNSGVTKNVGDIITESEVALWYVWIPRYKYQLFNVNNEAKTEQLIDIAFESGTETTGTVSCTTATNGVETCENAENGNWYTHPAFTLGNQELTGIWVGKFEVSGTSTLVTIKPNVSSWRKETVSTFFNSIQKIVNTYSISNGDSHMMKNSEWGAVAYLKQSKYGLGMTDIVANTNSGYLTGGGSNNFYKTNIDQSTTGNITGIYDMSGGAQEYVMGNMVNSGGSFYSSGAGFRSVPESKYYDRYAYDASNNTTHARGHLGDATREVLKVLVSPAKGWYGDYTAFTYETFSWLNRGDFYGANNNDVGIFCYRGGTNGSGYEFISSRAVLTKK